MTPDAPARYRAFISYSHADAGFGRRLHRRLEAYALPGRLVGRATPRGPVPRRLAPIFRDREELPAAGDLSAEVRAALAQSGALVVVCSPRAAASPWVGREVALFRELHPGRPVLAALIDGEPAEAFPEILTTGGAEPLAADFREGRDGPRLGLLKLVAGIVGVGLDELVQRDAQRRLRGVMGVTAASVTAMLAMGVLTLFALNARAEAERERTEAEGLVEFMMTDLRTRLEAVAGLDALTAANRRALAYYERQDLRHLSTTALLRRTEIITAMGQDDVRRKDFGRALAQFHEARRTTGALLAANPDDPDRIYAHAQSEYWVALAYWRSGNIDAARDGLTRYAALTRRLLAIDPEKPEWRMEAGYAESNLGTLELTDPAKAKVAEEAFTRSLSHFLVVARAKAAGARMDMTSADIQVDIADAHGWIADCRRAQKQYARARESRRDEERILRALQAADPKNRMYAASLQFNAMAQAVIDLEDGDPRGAAARLLGAWETARTLAAADPDDKEQATQSIVTGVFLADALLKGGRSPRDARVGLAGCGAEAVASEQELRDYCAVVLARLARAEGRADDPAFGYLARNRDRMTKVRRSPRWGLDFSRELAGLA